MGVGRIIRWLKQLLTVRKEEHRRGLEESRVDGAEKERKRWSFSNQRKSGVDSGRRASGGQAAGESPPPRVKSWRRHRDEEEDAGARREKAAVVIQKTFRGYLARKALRALRSLVKLQALVRGYLVRKQAAMTLHRLQTLMRLQANSIAVKKTSYRKSMEQERISAQEAGMRTPATPAHHRRLSDSTDSNYERSPRIVEMDTCHVRSRSSRMAGRFSPERRPAAPAPPSSPLLPSSKVHPARLSFRRSGSHESDPRGSKTEQNTPRFAASASALLPPYDSSSPAKSADGGGGAATIGGAPRWSLHHRPDALVSPRYMAGTASSAARMRCHSAPRQRQYAAPAATEGPRASPAWPGTTWRSPSSQAHGGFYLDPNRTAAVYSERSVGDDAARDYYLDSMW